MTPRQQRNAALQLQRDLMRIIRADDRTLPQVAEAAGVSLATLRSMRAGHAVSVVTFHALAGAVGYGVSLRRRGRRGRHSTDV